MIPTAQVTHPLILKKAPCPCERQQLYLDVCRHPATASSPAEFPQSPRGRLSQGEKVLIACVNVVAQIFILLCSPIVCYVLQQDSGCSAWVYLPLVCIFAYLVRSTYIVYHMMGLFCRFFSFNVEVFEHGILKRSINDFSFLKFFPI